MNSIDPVHRWVVRGLRATVDGVLCVPLAVLNVLVLLLAVAALVLVPVLGLGLVAFPWAVRAVRWRAELGRRSAGRLGVVIESPYRPATGGGPWRRFRSAVGEAATWRDIAWLVPGAITGVLLGTAAFGLPAYGLEGALLVPFWLYVGGIAFGYGVTWPFDTVFEAASSWPQGVVFLVVGLSVAPLMMWVHHRFAKLLLAPTTTARLTRRVETLTVTRADSVDAQAAELRRIERDLHDGAQTRLVSVSLSIGLAEELMDRDPAAARQLLAEARRSSGAALVELRHLVRGIHPPVLAERGLDGAIRALALGLGKPVAVDLDLPGRPQMPVETAAYFAVSEALANVAKHSGARTARVSGRHTGGVLSLAVHDDGVGGADPAGGTGLRGIARRLAAFDGTMTLSSPPGGPTVVNLEMPCVLSSPRTRRS